MPPPVTAAPLAAPESTPLWQRIVARLPQRDPDTEWYRPEDIAPLLGIQRRSVYVHLRQLWPNHEGEWRLSLAEAERVIKRASFAGKKVRRANPLTPVSVSALTSPSLSSSTLPAPTLLAELADMKEELQAASLPALA